MSYSPKGGSVNGAVIGSPQNALYMPQGGYQGQMQQIGGNAGGQNAMRPQYGTQAQAPEQNAEKDKQRRLESLQEMYKEEFGNGNTNLDFDGWFSQIGRA